MTEKKITFIPNSSIVTAQHIFMEAKVDVAKTLQSWRESLFSFEWIDSDGKIKTLKDLSDRERPKRKAVEDQLQNNQQIERPVLGMGLNDAVEIGSGRAVFLTLADHGHTSIPVHIPKSNESDFKAFLVDVN